MGFNGNIMGEYWIDDHKITDFGYFGVVNQHYPRMVVLHFIVHVLSDPVLVQLQPRHLSESDLAWAKALETLMKDA